MYWSIPNISGKVTFDYINVNLTQEFKNETIKNNSPSQFSVKFTN